MNKKIKFVILPISLILLIVVGYLFIFTAPNECNLRGCISSIVFEIPEEVFVDVESSNITINFVEQNLSLTKKYDSENNRFLISTVNPRLENHYSNDSYNIPDYAYNGSLTKLKEIEQIEIINNDNKNKFVLNLKNIEEKDYYANGRACGVSCTNTIFYFE